MGIRSLFGGGKGKPEEHTEEQERSEEQVTEESEELEESEDSEEAHEAQTLDTESDAESRVMPPLGDDEDVVSNMSSPPPLEEDGDDETEVEEAPRKHTLKIRPRTAQELFLDAIPERARFAGPNLKSHLTGKIRFIMKPSGAPYTIDWSGSELRSIEGAEGEAACTIDMNEADLMRIVSGELNPQVAMLSHKVRIQGNAEQASYVFNLIAPSHNNF